MFCGCSPFDFSKLDVFGACVSSAGLKSWGACVGSNLSLLREKPQVFEFPGIVNPIPSLWVGFKMRFLSQPFLSHLDVPLSPFAWYVLLAQLVLFLFCFCFQRKLVHM